MNFLKKALSKVNDDYYLLYIGVMLLFLFSSAVMFTENAGYYKGSIIVYIVAVLFVTNGNKKRRLDISDNWKKYLFYFGFSFVFFGLVLDPSEFAIKVPFANWISKYLYVFFVIGFSESLIRKGIQDKLKNPIVTSIVMAILHIGSYMGLLGASFSLGLLVYMLIQVAIGFYVFYWIERKTDVVVESFAHGSYDLFIAYTGGF